jgi:proline iminopeptidase
MPIHRRLGWRTPLRCLAFVGLLALAVLAGCAALAGVAALTAWPVVFLSAGWIVFAVGVALAVRLVFASKRLRITAVTLAVLSVLGAVALLWPAPGEVPGAPPGTRWVNLPTGSRLAYQELAGTGSRQATPVIFLHGGPGIADIRGDAPYLRRLADAGWDVYLYDQLGAGRSTRLADPTGYTLAREVADLDAFRQSIGAARIDLFGYSWGSTLAAAYLAAYPQHVAKVVFASPGPMVGGASDATDLLGRLGPSGRWAVLSQVLQPRPLLAWTLAQISPRAAHGYAGDAEMDTRFRAISAAAAPALYCAPPPITDGGDVGFYASYTLLRPAAWRDPHPALRHLSTPALVVKGSCDYLSWTSATDYRDTLPDAGMIYLPGAGHRIYAERPDAFFAAVNAFLTGQPLPLPVNTSRTPPPDYQGPHGN